MARVFISHSSLDNEPAALIKNWLSDQGFETPFLDFDKHSGIPPGANWEKTLYREIALSDAVVIIQTANWFDSKWCFAEFAQARALGKPIFPLIENPAGNSLISQDIQALHLYENRSQALEQLSEQLVLVALDAQGGFSWDANRSPYPGLLAFQEHDAAVYFGRDDEIRRLIERLNAHRAQGGCKLLALLGPSGSGKSSLLRAGVIPRLKRAGLNWVVLPPMRPQKRPVDELARSLALAFGGKVDWRKFRERLDSEDLGLELSNIASDLRMMYASNEAQILLPIDQGEEMFGDTEPKQAKRFFEILNIALSYELPFIAIITLRSDFLGLLQSAENLSTGFEEFSLAPLPLSRIPKIIKGPAEVAGLGVEEAFVYQAALDAETEDALPLLAFTLRQLYDDACASNYLSLAAYTALGDNQEGLSSLENAVRKAADNVLAEAKPYNDELLALRDAFLPAMVRVNEQGEYIRQPARWADLPSKSHRLLEKLVNARLLTVSQDGDDRTVEVTHEALLRKWPRLRLWLDEARVFLVGKQQLEMELQDWTRSAESEKSAALLSGLKLNRARNWLQEYPQQFTALDREFIQASIENAEAEERRKIHLRNKTLLMFIVILIISIGAIIGTLFSVIGELVKAQANRDLNVGESVFSQLMQNRSQQFFESVELLSSDFGFRQAIASGDKDTILSGLSNSGHRIDADLMSIISLDGKVIAHEGVSDESVQNLPLNLFAPRALVEGGVSTVGILDEKAYQLFVVPVRSPVPIALLVVGFSIDHSVLAEMKKLIMLDISVWGYNESGLVSEVTTLQNPNDITLGGIAGSLSSAAQINSQSYLTTPIELAKNDDYRVEARLSVSLALANASFSSLRWQILLIGGLSLILSILAAYVISRNITRPTFKLQAR